MCFFVQTNHTRKELLFLMFKEINLRNHSSLHKLFYSLNIIEPNSISNVLFFLKYNTKSKVSSIFVKITPILPIDNNNPKKILAIHKNRICLFLDLTLDILKKHHTSAKLEKTLRKRNKTIFSIYYSKVFYSRN